jgi:site-specific recombinase XerC
MSKKIVDKIEYEIKVSSENKRLVKDFLEEKKSQGKRPKTIYQYGDDMRIILTIIYQHFENKSLLEMTRKDIRSLSLLFQDMGMSNARVNRLMSCLRSALEYFVDDDDLEYDNNVGKKVKGLKKEPVRDIKFLKDEWIYQLRDELIKRGEILLALWHMMSYITAARKNELLQIQKDGLRNNFCTNFVIGKRAKKFQLFYDQDCQDLINQYLDLRGEDNIPDLFVHVFKNGIKRKVQYGTINTWCAYFSKVLSSITGIQVKYNNHAYRHSRLEALATGKNKDNSKIDLSDLQVLANHSDPGTTKSYILEHKEESIGRIFKMNPEDIINSHEEFKNPEDLK